MASYPNTKFRYKVEVEGVELGGFSEVSGADMSIDVAEYREGDMVGDTPMKVAGMKKYGNITLKKGISTDGKALYDWFASGLTEEVERKTVTITVLDDAQSPVASWQCIQAWPIKYVSPDLNATSSEVAIESVEFCHEGLTRVQ